MEADGIMAEMNTRLADRDLATCYRAAHESYLADRAAIAADLDVDASIIDGVSAGGMPTRVKCLHALAAHSLAVGPGINPLGDEAVARLGRFWTTPCDPAPLPPESGPPQADPTAPFLKRGLFRRRRTKP
jgi:hypothetical protein